VLYLAWRVARGGAPEARDDARPLGFLGGAAFQWVNPKAWVAVLGAVTAPLTLVTIPEDRHLPWLPVEVDPKRGDGLERQPD
jgi:hypothetical protein